MTIKDAFKKFVYALTGNEPVGDNIADVMDDSCGDVENICALATDLEALTEDVTELDGAAVKYEDEGNKSFVLNSSTIDSVKRFKITVTDDGTLSATELVEEVPAG